MTRAQLVRQVVDVAVDVRVESTSLATQGDWSTQAIVLQGAVNAACACGRIALFVLGGVLCAVSAAAAILAPALKAAGVAAIEAAKGCDCE